MIELLLLGALVVVVIAYECRLEGERDARRAVQLANIGLREELEKSLAHYDCLAEQHEDLMEATQPDADVWADGAVEADELQDALIPAHEAMELRRWFEDSPSLEER